ncbi:MAG: IS3 family transposase [Burkholderiaceae bacterium]
MENFFQTVKIKWVNRRGIYITRNEAKAVIFDYIECFYNQKHRRWTIRYGSPVNFKLMQYA